MKKLAIFFDLDGTLLNTIGDIANTCNEIMHRYGYPEHDIDEYKQMVGNGFNAMIQKAIFPNPVPENLDELVSEAREYYKHHMKKNTFPYPGMEDILKKLQINAGLGVLSNKPDDLTIELVHYFFPNISFEKIAGASPGLPLKPDPLVLMCLYKEAGLEDAKKFYVGDSDVDIETAKNAGIYGAGAAWGFRGRKELEEAGASIILEKPQDLLTLSDMVE